MHCLLFLLPSLLGADQYHTIPGYSSQVYDRQKRYQLPNAFIY